MAESTDRPARDGLGIWEILQMTELFAKVDVQKLFDQAQELTQKANSEKEYKAAARA
jgi:hypothetical protein